MARYGLEYGRGDGNRAGRGGWGGGYARPGYAGDYRGGRGGRGGWRRRGYRGGVRGSWHGSYDRDFRSGYGRDFGDRLRESWRDVKRTTRRWLGHGRGRYDRGW